MPQWRNAESRSKARCFTGQRILWLCPLKMWVRVESTRVAWKPRPLLEIRLEAGITWLYRSRQMDRPWGVLPHHQLQVHLPLLARLDAPPQTHNAGPRATLIPRGPGPCDAVYGIIPCKGSVSGNVWGSGIFLTPGGPPYPRGGSQILNIPWWEWGGGGRQAEKQAPAENLLPTLKAYITHAV